jgi:hypothetical protein
LLLLINGVLYLIGRCISDRLVNRFDQFVGGGRRCQLSSMLAAVTDLWPADTAFADRRLSAVAAAIANHLGP